MTEQAQTQRRENTSESENAKIASEPSSSCSRSIYNEYKLIVASKKVEK